nr:exonuclease domain-containing protein [Enterococcus hirae]
MDTETTGLSLDDDIWEFAAIRREVDGSESETHLFIQHDLDKCASLPEQFYADHKARFPSGENWADTQESAAQQIASLFTDRPHVVGAVPNFDTERIALLLRRHGIEPGWHYHLIDVENLAIGYLAAQGVHLDLPWNSDALTAALGLPPVPEDERHTAMGDARWAMRIYDAVMGGAR